MKVIPCGHRIIIKPFKLEEVDEVYQRARASGLQIVRPNEKREDASVDKGIVLDIGPDCWPDSDKPWCEVGDTVLFAKFAAKLVEDPKTNETVGILNDMDVVAVIKEA